MLCVVIVLAERFGRKKREDMKKISKEDQEHLRWTAEQIVKHMDNGGHLQVIIHKTSKSNLSWQYSVYLWFANDEGQIEKMWLNWFIATMEGTNLTAVGSYVKGSGVGTERSFLVAYNLGHKLDTLLNWTDKPNVGYTYTNRVSGVF